MFQLDPRLAQDCVLVSELPLCKLLLMNDASYPWLILVPRVSNIKEIMELSLGEQDQLWRESRWVSRCLQHTFRPDKLNIAAIGNVVSQLHVHHIARYQNDNAWPAPVWGHAKPVAYSASALAKQVRLIQQGMETANDNDHNE